MAQEYFDLAARDYLQRCESGIMGRFRQTERKSVLSLLDPTKGQDVLDLGCGPGFYAEALKSGEKNWNVLGVDASESMVELYRSRGFPAVQADINHLPNLGKKFDVVLLLGVLEFVSNAEPLLSRLSSFTKPGSKIVVLRPKLGLPGFIYWLFHLSKRKNIKFRSSENLRNSMENMGACLVERATANSLSEIMVFQIQ